MKLFNNPIAFMFHDIPREDPWEILEYFKEYLNYDTKYIIAMETEPYIHYHVVIDWVDKTYNAFVAKVLRKQLKLRGRATEGGARQYGRVLGIKKPDKMVAYTLKQGVYISNIEEDLLEPYKQMSFTRKTSDKDKEIREGLLEFTDEFFKNEAKYIEDTQILKAILRYLLKEKIRVRTRGMVEGYLFYLRQFSKNIHISRPCSEYFYDHLFNF